MIILITIPLNQGDEGLVMYGLFSLGGFNGCFKRKLNYTEGRTPQLGTLNLMTVRALLYKRLVNVSGLNSYTIST